MGRHKISSSEHIDFIYEFIVQYATTNHGLSPTLREIMHETGVASTSMASFYLRKLEDQRRIIFTEKGRFFLPGATWTPPASN